MFVIQVAQVSPLKKVPSKCKRGLAARLAAKKEKVSEENDSSEISEESAVYSTQVARMLSKRGLPDANQLQLLSKLIHDTLNVIQLAIHTNNK